MEEAGCSVAAFPPLQVLCYIPVPMPLSLNLKTLTEGKSEEFLLGFTQSFSSPGYGLIDDLSLLSIQFNCVSQPLFPFLGFLLPLVFFCIC